MRRALAALIVVALAPVFSACAVMESRLAPETDGIVYYLPRSLMKVSVSPQPDSGNPKKVGQVDFAFEPVYISDVRHRYVLNYQNNPLFNDRLCVMVGADGMLSSVEYATEDATPRILVALAELAGKATGPSAAITAVESADRRFEGFNIVFDPFDARGLDETNAHINSRLGLNQETGYRFDLDLPASARPPRQSCDGKGVCFRTKIKTAVSLTKGKNRRLVGFDTVEVMSEHIGSVDLSRAFLVEKVMRLGFEGGALTQLVMKKPSEGLQAVKLPLDILEVLLAVPANFANSVTGTTAARQAYVAEIEARTTAMQNINNSLAKIAKRTAAEGGGSSVKDEEVFKIKCEGKVPKNS